MRKNKADIFYAPAKAGLIAGQLCRVMRQGYRLGGKFEVLHKFCG
jgi:hypothetical protein